MKLSSRSPNTPIITIPATTRSYRFPAFRESMVRKPSPELSAIISAATTTSHATPRLMRIPTMMCGRAAGTMTRRSSLNPVTPKFWEARMYWPSMV